jgi:hypothetical protein
MLGVTGGTTTMTVPVPPGTGGEFVMVNGDVMPEFVWVTVVNVPGGTTTTTVPVPPGVAGGLVKVTGPVNPEFVDVTVV